MNHLRVLGLNHTTAPIDVRERLAFAPEHLTRLNSLVKDANPNAELIVLSTCNRVELYTAGTVIARDDLVNALSLLFDLSPQQFAPHLFEHHKQAAAGHLFRVASSLDSMIAGETQILGQVRDALARSVQLNSAGGVLAPLFQKALAAGKDVLSSTAISGGASGVAGAAVAYAKQVFDDFSSKHILSIGAGKMGLLVLAGFSRLAPGKLSVISRDIEKASRAAEPLGGTAYTMDDLQQQLIAADVVVSSTAARQPIVTRAMLERLMPRRRYRPLLVIDIAVPRDFEHAAGEIDGVFLYDLDDLQREVDRSVAGRHGAIDAATQIVERHLSDYFAWENQRAIGPTIDAIYARGNALAKDEFDSFVDAHPELDAKSKDQLERAMKRLVNKLLHAPVAALKQAHHSHRPDSTPADPRDADKYLHAVQKLFQLDDDTPSAP